MLPIDTVNDSGFRNMLKEFEPRYQLPDRKTIANNYLPAMFEEQKKLVRQNISKASHYAITTDAWTSRANHAYTTLTVHYIDNEYSLRSHILETREFAESHTAHNIAEGLKDSLLEWGLSDQSLAGVATDNGANMVAAIRELNWTEHHFPCFSHTLQHFKSTGTV